MKQWYEDWFASEDYLEVYKHRNREDANKIIKLILNNIQLNPDSKILDIACGAGRHSSILSEKSFFVVGFDLSKTLLHLAIKENLHQLNPPFFFLSDIRKIPIKKRFNLVLNLFTSFGYFDIDNENLSLFSDVFHLLENNGWFVFDYLNEEFLKNNLIPVSRNKLNENLIIEQRREIENNFVIKKIKIIRDKISTTYTEKVKLYNYKQILDEINKAGFKEFKLFGNYEGNQFDQNNSQRLIIMAKK